MQEQFLLDTDTVSFFIRGRGNVKAHLEKLSPSHIGVSAITVAELRFGASKRQSQRLHHLIDLFLADITAFPFDQQAAYHFGELSAAMESRGQKIGLPDTMIAAHALCLDRVLVTHNQKHFGRIEALRIADWF